MPDLLLRELPKKWRAGRKATWRCPTYTEYTDHGPKIVHDPRCGEVVTLVAKPWDVNAPEARRPHSEDIWAVEAADGEHFRAFTGSLKLIEDDADA